MESIKYIKKIPKSRKLILNLPSFRIGQTVEIDIKSTARKDHKKSVPFDMEKWAKKWSIPIKEKMDSNDTELFTGRKF